MRAGSSLEGGGRRALRAIELYARLQTRGMHDEKPPSIHHDGARAAAHTHAATRYCAARDRYHTTGALCMRALEVQRSRAGASGSGADGVL
jgi:hypothetical protein